MASCVLRSKKYKFNLLNNRPLRERKATMGNDLETSGMLLFALFCFTIVSNSS
jgi:hypothetical protein